MPASPDHSLRLEIGHVLFLDLVGYSQLMMEEQKARLRQLTDIALATSQVARSTNEQLVKLPTGDGMALVFRENAEEPARCALEIAQALQNHPEVRVRMGLHSGPVSEVTDVSGRANLAGAGINLAQRVMDCGDAGHILLSRHLAEDLEHYSHWRPLLHDLGECEVKHGVRLHLFSLYDERRGNPAVPAKLQAAATAPAPQPHRARSLIPLAVLGLLLLVGTLLYSLGRKPSPAGAPATAAPTSVSDKSVAVLPFENLSSEKDNAYFADGVQDEILTDLAKIGDLKVISRTSVMRYRTDEKRNLREIGQQLGVAHLLEGSVQRASNQVRVNAQLINARTDAHEWAENYDRPLTDVFGIQSEIAKAIADQLQARIVPAQVAQIDRKPTSNLQAYDAYLRGRALSQKSYDLSVPDRLQSIKYLREAVQLDPSFVDAWAILAREALIAYFNFVDRPASLTLGREAARKTAELRPGSAEAILAQGYLAYYGEEDFAAATRWFEQARQLAPNDSVICEALALITQRTGEWQKSTGYFAQAVELDPLDPQLLEGQCAALVNQRNYPAALTICDTLLKLGPSDAWPLAMKIGIYQSAGNLEAAAPLLPAHLDPGNHYLFLAQLLQWLYRHQYTEVIAAVPPAAPPAGEYRSEFERVGLLDVLAWAYRLLGKREEALQTSQQLVKLCENAQAGGAGFTLGTLAEGYAMLGDKEKAIATAHQIALSKDATIAFDYPHTMASIGVLTSDRELALTQLAISARTVGGVSYGDLRFNPAWDPLRNDPRFDKIVASLAPGSTP